MKPAYSIDTGPMVPGRNRSKPSKGGKNSDSEKTPFLFPRWETKYVDSIDVLGKLKIRNSYLTKFL